MAQGELSDYLEVSSVARVGLLAKAETLSQNGWQEIREISMIEDILKVTSTDPIPPRADTASGVVCLQELPRIEHLASLTLVARIVLLVTCHQWHPFAQRHLQKRNIARVG